MSLPIDRTAKATLDGNLVNGNTSDAPAIKGSNDVVYNTIDELFSSFKTSLDGVYNSDKFTQLGIINVKDLAYKASGSAQTTTGSITAGSKILTLLSPLDFLNGQGINVAGNKEVDNLQITAAATVSSNVTVTLNGVAYTVAVLAGDTIAQVATKIRAAAYAGWTTGGATDTITFTSSTTGVKTTPVYSAGTTTAAGTMSVTTLGTADLITSIVSGAGTNTLTLAASAITTVTSVTVNHDDTAAIQAAINAVGASSGGVVYFPAGTYRTTLPITPKQGVELLGASENNTIIQKDGNATSTIHPFDSVIGYENLNPNYVVIAKINKLQIRGLSNNDYGIKLNYAAQIHLGDLQIYNVKNGIDGDNVWLAEFDNVTCRNLSVQGNIGFNIKAGTSCTFIRCWSKNFAGGYNLGSTDYSVLNGCAAESFSNYAYNNGSAITYNGCGAEAGTLLNGGFVFGCGAREIVLNGCDCLNIDTIQAAGNTSLFYFNGSQAKVTGFRLPSFNTANLIDLVKTDIDASVTIENSVLPANYYRKTNQLSASSSVVIKTGDIESHYFSDSTKQYTLSAQNFYTGYKLTKDKEAVGKSTAETVQAFSATAVIHKNNHTVYSGGAASTAQILQISNAGTGNFLCSFHFRVHINSLSDSGMYEGYGTISNGVKNAITLTSKYGAVFTISVTWSGNILQVTLTTTYSMASIETTVIQNNSTGNMSMLWL